MTAPRIPAPGPHASARTVSTLAAIRSRQTAAGQFDLIRGGETSTVTAPDGPPPRVLAEDDLAAASPDPPRTMAKTLADALVSAEADAVRNAAHGRVCDASGIELGDFDLGGDTDEGHVEGHAYSSPNRHSC